MIDLRQGSGWLFERTHHRIRRVGFFVSFYIVA